jgi:acyl-CoA synthetase (AMP-forming)/AMP-acid ligase II
VEAGESGGLQALVDAIGAGSGLDDLAGARAVSDAKRHWTYGELIAEAGLIAERLRAAGPSGLLLLQAGQDAPSVAALLGGLAAGYQVMLQAPEIDADVRARLDAAFAPDAHFADGVLTLAKRRGAPIHPAPAILLSTSGTTGSAKFVRLSLGAIAANARQIAQVLRIGAQDVALGHLPLHYSYGLSVLTSHLEKGAAIHLTGLSFTQPDLWAVAAAEGVTHLPGVPFHYQFLARGALASLVPPCVTSFTQAGGALALPFRQRVHDAVAARGGRFYVMYGQTEAGPRITTLDHDDFPGHPESVGPALPGGRLTILDDAGAECAPGEEGEVVYGGPNLMAGYAIDRAGLSGDDAPLATIRTGDRGMLDARGFLTLRGRNRSFAKVGGLRLNLDEIAARLTPIAEVALLPGDDRIHVFHAGPDDALKPALRDLAIAYAIPPTAFSLRAIADMPRLASGKIDYQRLRDMAQ